MSDNNTMASAWLFLTELMLANGYPAGKLIAPGRRGRRYAAIQPKLCTHAIITGGTP